MRLPGRRAQSAAWWFSATTTVAVLPACGTTVDSLGHDRPRDAGTVLRPLSGPALYPNAFKDVLGKTDIAIADKVSGAFDQLFHGNPASEAIYFPVGNDQAYIRDILHDDIRTEGIGYGLIIAVELDKRDEFDRLWRYAKAVLQYKNGPNLGYFPSSCDSNGRPVVCNDPFGLEQFVTALLFAHDRWGSNATINYGADALSLFDLMRHKEEVNGGVVQGVTNTFDAASKLVFDVPSTTAADYTRPSLEMPAYYELWAQATGDSFWIDAAAAARAYFKRVAHPATGLLPVRSHFDGSPVAGSDTFAAEAYRTQLNITLDHVWFGTEPWEVDESNRLIAFFFGQGIEQYGRAYTLDGANLLDPLHDASLVAVNGVTALAATMAERTAFIDAVWNLALPTGAPRYYAGLLDLLALLVLSGQYRVY